MSLRELIILLRKGGTTFWFVFAMYALSIAVLFLSEPASAAITLSAGNCQTFTLFNSTGNSSFNESICAQNVTFNITGISSPNITINITGGICPPSVVNFTFVGTNISFIEERYLSCQQSVLACNSERASIGDSFNSQLRTIQENTTRCGNDFISLSNEFDSYRVNSEKDKNSGNILAAIAGAVAYHFFFRKKEEEEISEVGELPPVM